MLSSEESFCAVACEVDIDLQFSVEVRKRFMENSKSRKCAMAAEYEYTHRFKLSTVTKPLQCVVNES